jgi:SAM-dependent methyltransferase
MAGMYRSTAQVYDLIYDAEGKDYAAEALELRRAISSRKPDARSLLDVACGTGRHLAFLRDWYDVAGIDADPEMLTQARSRVPQVALVEADMRTFDLGRSFDAVVCLFSAIGYMRTTEELDLAVAAMARHLTPGGVLIVDGWVRPDRWRGDVTTHIDTAETDAVKVVRCSLNRRMGNVTHLEMHHLIATTDGIEHLVDHHALTLFEPDDYETAFTRKGLHVEVVPSPMPDRDRYIGTSAPRS